MLIAEDVLLLLTDDRSGKHALDGTKLDLVLGGAVLMELAVLERVRVSGHGEPVRPGRVVVVDAAPTGDAVLDEGLRRLAERAPRKPDAVLKDLARGLRAGLLDRLTRRGILRYEEGRVLGIFTTRAWPAEDWRHEEALRRGLRDVLVTGRAPTTREASLVSLLQAADKVPHVVGPVDVPARELRRRAKALVAGDVAGQAVRTAIQAIDAAMAAVLVTTAVAGGAAGS